MYINYRCVLVMCYAFLSDIIITVIISITTITSSLSQSPSPSQLSLLHCHNLHHRHNSHFFTVTISITVTTLTSSLSQSPSPSQLSLLHCHNLHHRHNYHSCRYVRLSHERHNDNGVCWRALHQRIYNAQDGDRPVTHIHTVVPLLRLYVPETGNFGSGKFGV